MPDKKDQGLLSKLMEMEADARNNVIMNSTVKNTASKILRSVEDDDVKLKVNRIWVENKRDNKDVAAQKDVRMKGQVWGNDLRADLELIDKKTGKVVDRVPSMKVSNIPKITDRGTYIVGGNEYQFTKQSRLKPGVYTKRQTNGEISSFFNVDKTVDFDRGFNNNFKINFNPEKKTFTMGYGSKNIPLYNALKAVGISGNEMRKAWGESVYNANSAAYEKHEVRDQNKLYEAIFGKQPAPSLTLEGVKKEIKERLFETKLDADTTKITLGKSYGEVNKGVLIDASKKIIDIHRGDKEGDDRESLIFKSFYDVEDHIREKLVKNSKKIINNIKHKLKKNKSINKSLSSQSFDPFVVGTITTSQLSNPPNQTNPMSIIGEASKVTVMGEGGIGTSNAVTNETRAISNSEAGFLDPLHTPEGGQIGVSVHSSTNTIKIGEDIYSKFLNKSGKKVFLRPIDVYNKNVAFPDQYDTSRATPKPFDKKVKVIKAGKFDEVSPKDVDVIIASPMGMFDTSANSIPFLDSIQGNRGLTASKMQEQALSLSNRDKPLFSVTADNDKPLAEVLGGVMASPHSPVSGKVMNVTDDNITIKDKDGKKHDVQLYNNFSLNTESFLHNTPIVKAGDSIKRGALLADNNFTRDGQISLGANLRVAYMPYKGYNYEDSAIISESAAKKLASQHIYDLKTKRSSKGVFSREKFKAYYPEELTAKNSRKLDAAGVVKPGQTVERGDVVIAHMEKRSPTADDLAIGRLDKQLKRDMSDDAIRWENDNVGTITGVEKHGNSVVVNVKTEEPVKVADKISGLHGNKHIISKIVKDEEMPYKKESGEHIELTMSPIGVSNRINTSQLLEAAAGKIAKKTGKQYKIKNFDRADNSRKIMKDLKDAGLSDKEILVDPETGKELLNPVSTGDSHIIKLEHKVDHKFSARYKDGYDSNEQPITGGEAGGKNLGRMEMSALLARGATENLKEAFQVKGQRNDEYWRAMETGQSLPPPKNAFVWDKMLANMAGAGINVEQKGKTFTLKPMTDEEILSRSKGELKKPFDTYRKKDLAPMKEGLFDPVKAGGMMGEHYTHFKLPEKILNPITARAAANLLDMPMNRLEDVITGKKFVDRATGKTVDPGTPNSISGGPAIEIMLSKIKVNEDLKQAEEVASKTSNPTELNKMHRKIRNLKSLKENKMKPTDYMIENVLVTPSKYRPMFSMGTEGTVIMSDINDLYQQTAYSADALKSLDKDLKAVVPDDDVRNIQLAESRGQLYNDVRAVSGLREPTSYLHRVRDKKGFISQIDGGKKQTKEGFFQDKVLERRQDLVGRSTIILNPDLGGDQIGVPKEMATQIFQPFIMKKLVSWGYPPLEAQKQIKDKTKVYERALQVVSDERLVIANRAPTLHRWNMTAFKPQLTDGKSVEVPAVVVHKNFGGDFDGDCSVSSIISVIKISDLYKVVVKDKKTVFFGDLGLDSSTDFSYNIDRLKQMEVRMPGIFKIITLSDDEIAIHHNISQFPRIEESKEVNKKNGNEDYDVPDGIKIFTIDNITHEFKKIDVEKFSIHKNLVNYTIETSSGDSMLLSSDQSAVAINISNWEIEKVTPEDLKNGLLIPKVRNIKIDESISSIKIDNNDSQTKKTNKCKEQVKLDYDFGWFIGSMIGDGWVSGDHQLCIASVEDSVGNKFHEVVNSILEKPAKLYIKDSQHKFKGYECFSKKYTVSSKILYHNIGKLIGKGAANKHLPSFYMASPEEFRLGLLSGLLDTDGSVGWLKKKKGRQFNIQYSSISEILTDQIVSLCRSLGISASITIGNKSENGLERRTVISTNTVHGKNIRLLHEEKKKAFEEFCSESIKDSSVSARQDIVPFSPDLFVISKEFVHHIKNIDVYRNINDSKRTGWRLSRQSAKRLIELDVDQKLPERWKQIVANEDVTWVYAKKVTLNKERIDMYDITAPGPYTFMLDNGIIVQDTFQIFNPISNKAMAEAEKMLPSASMLKTGYDSVLNVPEVDMVVGSWLVSKGKGGKDTKLKFKDLDEARYSFKNNNITYADTVEINGKRAPFGMHEINSVVPEDSRRWDIELNFKNVESWIRDVTKNHNGKISLGLADKIKDVGNNYSTKYGFTLGVSDTLSDTDIRDSILREASGKLKGSKQEDKLVSAYYNATMKAQNKLEKKHGENTMLGIGMRSGGSKGVENVSAINLMPGIVTDANDKPIPIPIKKSYSEGLDTFDYWAAAHGARGGNIKKSVSSFKPGWLTKDLMNSIYDTRIYADDPVDKTGLEYKLTDKKGITNRYMAQDAKTNTGKIIAKRNELVDSDVVNKLVKNKIKSIFIQSPLTDPSPGDGFSSYSYGADYEGKRHNVGDNIGIISAHTLTEPSLNLAMKAFHTGGALKKGKSSGTVFDRLDRTLRFTKNLPDKATLASMDGTVKSITKSPIGGHDVILERGDKQETRYIDPNNDVLVKRGDKVKSGAKLSSGTPSAHDMLKYTGMPTTQRFLVNEISDINDGKLDKRDIETIVRGITNTTRIMHPGSSPNFVSGDVAQLSTVNNYNENNLKEEDIDKTEGDHLAGNYGGYNKGSKITKTTINNLSKTGVNRVKVYKDRIKHEPFLTPTGIQAKAQTSEDWISRLAHNRIKKVLEEGTTMGWKSTIDPKKGHPLPAYITGEYTW